MNLRQKIKAAAELPNQDAVFGHSTKQGARMENARLAPLIESLIDAVEALELIASPSTFNCAIGESNQRAAAQKALAKLHDVMEGK